jgi:arylamine N-acetyltransferase
MHIVNIVTLADGSRYVVDVSFGGDGPTRPLPLIEKQVCTNLGAQQVRLVWESLPEQVSSRSKSWIYQYRNGVEKPWNSYYAFNEVEWLPADFTGPNYYVSQHGDSFQRHMLLVVRFLRGDESIVGKRMLAGNVVKENKGERTAVLKICESEKDRVDALQELFGIELTTEERQAIQGYRTQILPSS